MVIYNVGYMANTDDVGHRFGDISIQGNDNINTLELLDAFKDDIRSYLYNKYPYFKKDSIIILSINKIS